MKRSGILIAALGVALSLLWVACGSGDSMDANSGAPSSASSGAAGSGSAAMPGESEVIKNCLSLVGDGRFQEAISPCSEALRNYPGNQQVQNALAEAKKGAMAGVADTEDAAAAAKAKLGEAAGGLKLP